MPSSQRLITAACLSFGVFIGVALAGAARTFVRDELAAQRAASAEPVDARLAVRRVWPAVAESAEEEETVVRETPAPPRIVAREAVVSRPPAPPSIVAGEAVVSTPSAPPLRVRTMEPAPPAAPGNVVATAAGPEHVVIRWSPVVDDPTIVRYEVLRAGNVVAAIEGGRADELGLRPGTHYCYSVISVKQSGRRSSPSAESCAITTDRVPADAFAGVPDYLPRARPPGAPMQLGAVPNSRSGIALVWRDASGDVRPAAYEIFRDGKLVASTRATFWVDRDLASGSEHCYAVAALGSSGLHSAPSGTACATTLVADGPGAPFDVEAQRDSKEIRLSWRAPADGVVYRVYDAHGRPVGTTSGVAYRVIEQPRRKEVLEPCFTVAAVDPDGRESAHSGAACVESLQSQSVDASQPGRGTEGSAPPAALAILPMRRRRRNGVTFVA